MVVVFEFLGAEPIENVITCMHYKVDKVVFFGYQEIIADKKQSTSNFLEKYCDVHNMVYHLLPKDDLQSILETMRKEIEYELGQKNRIYFDVTGGESLILVAFGMLSKEYNTPMHLFDVCKDKIIPLISDDNGMISEKVLQQKTELTLDGFIEMQGGVINHKLKKDAKKIETEEVAADVEKLWTVAKRYWDCWNSFSAFLRGHLDEGDSLYVNKPAKEVLAALAIRKTKLSVAKLNGILDSLEKENVLYDVVHEKGEYRFRYKNEFVKDCLWDGGSILELNVYQKEKAISADCRVGVHLDWDGRIKYPSGVDVLNEIDVLALQGNIPKFISCKSGNMDGKNALAALYELETVARRFGGKYAKKVLATVRPLGDVYMERAKEMGIEVWRLL